MVEEHLPNFLMQLILKYGNPWLRFGGRSLGFGGFFGWLVSWGLGGGVAVLFWCFVITQAIIAEADKIIVLVCNWLIHF